jgi:predicted small lipoprotein YifL
MSKARTRRGFLVTLAVLLALALSAPLSACGKKGNLEDPKNEKVQFPRNYPR